MASARRRGKWLLTQPLPGARARVFLLPYSGCGASMYWRWPAELGGVNFLPVQLPARENRLREPYVDSYEELADLLAEHLEPYLDRPYAFFGHCSSALPAYEASVRVVQRGMAEPTRLFVSSQVAPQDGPYGSFLEMDDEQLGQVLRDLSSGIGNAAPSSGFLDMALGVLRQDLEVNRRYHVPDPAVLPCPISVIGWTEDRSVPAELMGGWSACGKVERITLVGGHYTFAEAPPALLSEITAGLPEPVPAGEREP
ncbi:MAG TPA: thioesterase domain-containing protein [Kribbellaceae bacterium]|nr:thioesterase domain-containing protein [Kribbellaceae bacterium]